MTLRNQTENLLGLLLVAAGIAMRILPHPWNFTPVTAVALFSGAVLAPQIAFFLPLLIMIGSDLILGPHPLYPLTWGAFLIVSVLGYTMRGRTAVPRIFTCSIAGSTIFFLVTNLGVFIFQNMYEKSWAGLAQCYWMGLPFFRNAVLGDLFYAVAFFGLFALLKRTVRAIAAEPSR